MIPPCYKIEHGRKPLVACSALLTLWASGDSFFSISALGHASDKGGYRIRRRQCDARWRNQMNPADRTTEVFWGCPSLFGHALRDRQNESQTLGASQSVAGRSRFFTTPRKCVTRNGDRGTCRRKKGLCPNQDRHTQSGPGIPDNRSSPHTRRKIRGFRLEPLLIAVGKTPPIEARVCWRPFYEASENSPSAGRWP